MHVPTTTETTLQRARRPHQVCGSAYAREIVLGLDNDPERQAL